MHTDTDLIKEAIRQRRKQRAQSLTEFALILPVLLFFIMGIIDFGRVLFTYAQGSAAIRSALRYASVVGYNSPVYLDCDLMRTTAQSMFFDEGTPTVTIDFRKADTWNGTTFTTVYPNDGNCQGGPTSNDLTTSQRSDVKNGDILRISANISVAMMTPFFPSPLTFTLAGQRTLVTNIELVDAPYVLPAPLEGTQTADMGTFIAQLQDATSTAFLASATHFQGLTNTVVFNDGETATHQYQLDNGIPTFTPVPTDTVPSATPALPQVQNLQFWAGGARCSGNLTKRYIGLIWTKLTGVQGYRIYANGVWVGSTTDSKGKLRQCGRTLSASRTNRISGCFNINPGAWVAGSSVNYQVAAFTNNGAVIGPLSNVLTKTC